MASARSRRFVVAPAAAGVAALLAAPAAFAGPPAAPAPGSPSRLLVAYKAGTSQASARAAEVAAGASRVGSIHALGVHVLAVPAKAADAARAALARHPSVRYAEPDATASAVWTPNDPYWANQWGAAKVNAPKAWDVTRGSSTVTIAVVDSGVDPAQPDLQGKLVPGRDVLNGDADPSDDNGHGTMAAGVLGAATGNGSGVAAICGECRVMPVKVLGADGNGPYSAIANGITWAADNGAKVINLSLGGTSASTTLQSAVQYARGKGAVVVAAAGNNGSTTPFYPAAYPETISVAGTDSADALYSWSNRGASWVDVAAPGSNYTTGRDGWYGGFAGTSSATPVVAGIAGLALSATPTATPAQVEQAILSTAVRTGVDVAHGRVDAAAALTALGAAPAPAPAPAPTTSPSPTTVTTSWSGSLSSRTPTRSFAVQAGAGSLSATLTYAKVPSLTLELVAADGTVVARSQGGSPVKVAATVPAGAYRLVVSGSTKVSFTLSATHVAG